MNIEAMCDNKERDAFKDKKLTEMGMRVLRLPEKTINNNMELIMESVYKFLGGNA